MIGVIFVMGACLLWALDTLIRYPLLIQGISAEQIVFLEHLFLTIIFIPQLIKLLPRLWEDKVKTIFYFFVIGGLGSAIGTLAFTKAFGLINPSLVILLQKLQPLVAIGLARIILKERMSRTFIFWAGICLAGGVLIGLQDLMHGLRGLEFSRNMWKGNSLMGYGLTLIAVFSWGASTVFGKKLTGQGLSYLNIMAGRFAMGLLCLMPLIFSFNIEFELSWGSWAKILSMVLISGLLGMGLYYKGLSRISAKLCALAEMFFPFFAVSINWFFLDASLSNIQILGGALLLLGSTVIQLRHY